MLLLGSVASGSIGSALFDKFLVICYGIGIS
jgi:hypothetical protein